MADEPVQKVKAKVGAKLGQKYKKHGTQQSSRKLQDIAFANKHIQGVTTSQIAREAGMSRQTIQQRLKLPEIKDYIEKAQKRIISTCLEPAIDNMEYLVQNYKATTVDKEGVVRPVLDAVEKEHSFKMHMPVLEIAGVKPLPYQSQFIQNIYQDNKNVLILPVIEEALNKYVDSFKLISNESEE